MRLLSKITKFYSRTVGGGRKTVVEKSVIHAFKEVFHVDVSRETEVEFLALTSLDYLNIVYVLESDLGVEIMDQAIGHLGKAETVGGIIDYFEKVWELKNNGKP